jgi:hypothetical protein
LKALRAHTGHIFSFPVETDFLKGVTYKQTSDPLLKKIYETEDQVVEGDSEEEKNWKAVDPRQELFAAIRSRKS